MENVRNKYRGWECAGHKLMGSALYALGDFEGAKAALRESLK